MRPKDPLRVALVGCGRVAQSHVEALAALEHARLVAVVEPREAAGQAAAEGAQARWFADLAHPELIEAIDAAIVCTPPSTHHEIAGRLLELGKHVLCEKPLTIRSVDAVELAHLARENGLQLMMASKFRYVDDMIQAKAIIEAGTLGEVIHFENAFTSKVSMRGRWNAQREISGGGVLIDNGTHSVDMVRYLLGPIVSIQAQAGVQSQGLEVEDTVHLWVRTLTGAIGYVDLSWTIQKESPWYFGVFGSEGSLHIGWEGSRYRRQGSTRWIRFGSGYDKVQAFRSLLQNFIATVRGTGTPLMLTEDALASVRVIEAAYASSGRDNWTSVEGAE